MGAGPSLCLLKVTRIGQLTAVEGYLGLAGQVHALYGAAKGWGWDSPIEGHGEGKLVPAPGIQTNVQVALLVEGG